MSTFQKRILVLITILLVLSQSLVSIRNGLRYQYGLGFWGPSGHDGIWHLSLINQIADPFKIPHPAISGELLRNYHPFFDILIVFLSKATFIDTSIWLFQLFPVLSSLILILLSFRLGSKLTGNFWGGILLAFLNCLANSFGWVFTKGFYGESLFWAMQSPSNQINPPFVLSLIFILFYLNYPRSRLNYLFIPLIPITKSYAGLIIYSILFFRRQWRLLIITLIPAVILFLVYNSSSNNLFQFQPFWFISSMLESPDRFYIAKLASLKYSPYFPIFYIFGLLIFTVGNFSWRLLGFCQKTPDRSLLFTIIITFLIPLFFIQKGTPWNTIQFLYYGLFLSNIFLTLFLIKSKNKILTLIIITTSLLASIGHFRTYLGNPAPAAIPQSEIEALSFLKLQPKGVVLTYPYDQFMKNQFPATPLPLYVYETTAYISAYTGQQLYLGDEMNLEISGYNWQPRRQASLEFFHQPRTFSARGFLINNHIDYLYLTGLQRSYTPFDLTFLQVQEIFRNTTTAIYKVQK